MTILLACAGTTLAAEGAVYYAGGKAIELREVPDEVTIELDPGVDRSKTAVDLAQRGMPTLAAPQFHRRFGRICLVPVPRVDAETMANMRQAQGVVQVRKLYRDVATGLDKVATDRIVVCFKAGTTPAEMNAALAAHGLAKIRAIPGLSQTYLVRVTGDGDDAVLKAAALYGDPRTEYCHPDFVAAIQTAQVSDTYYSRQWHLHNTGQSGATVDADVDWPEARAEVPTLGDGIIVAIHDDSVQFNHEDLVAGFRTGWDFWDGDSDPSPGWPGDNHGTAVSGVALARINGLGVVGSAPAASLIGIRFGFFDSEIAEAFTFAMNNNADVINNSWGYPFTEPPDVVRDAIRQVATSGRNGKGMVVMFASHNFYTTIALGSPIAGLPEVIAIGASNSFDRRSLYSNWGPELCVLAPSNDVDVPTALGITTCDVEDDANLPTQGYNQGTGTDIYGLPDLPNGNYTQNFGGTSSATPLATGIVALILDVNPGLTAEQVRRVIEHTADKINPLGALYDPVAGRSEQYGFGRINAAKAVAAAKQFGGGNTWPPAVSNLKHVGTSTVNLTWRNPTEEFDSVMVVHSTAGPVTWTPAGMGLETPEDYDVGEFVAPQVQIVKRDSGNSFTADPGPGTQHYAVFARNPVGRWSWGRSISVNLSGKSAPLASIAATPRSGEAPLLVQFNGGAVDPDLENVDFTYSWNFGDGTSVANQQSTPHTFNSPGDYLVELEVTDETLLTGKARVMIRVLEEPHQPPTAQILLSPGDGEAPHTVRLTGSAKVQPGQTIDQYIWAFGDGTAAAGQIVEHTYINPGAYTITLEVVDNLGASAKAAIAVSVWSAEPTTGTPKPSTGSETGAQGCGTCGAAGLPTLIASMLGWGLLSLRRRRY